MKKSLLSAVILVEMIAGSVCSATVPQSQLEIGGIKYGATISAVKNKLGDPIETKSHTKNGVEKTAYKYNGIEVEFIDGKVYEVEVEDNSNLKTAAGIGIGSTLADVEKVYGNADAVHKDKYIYFTEDKTLKLVFKIRNGVVHEFEFGNFNHDRKFKERH